MLDHHLQRSIVYQLAFEEQVRFSDLKPDGLDNKVFSYHLKKTLDTGLVAKGEDGTYSLTPAGRRFSTGARDKSQALIVERAHSVLFLVIRRQSDGAWLLYERKTHPMRGYKGFIHANPIAGTSVEESARTQILDRTGLSGTFTALGGGYFTVSRGETIESFTNFTLLYCDDIQGDLAENDPKASYFWSDSIQIDSSYFPASQTLLDCYLAKQPFFVQQSFTID